MLVYLLPVLFIFPSRYEHLIISSKFDFWIHFLYSLKFSGHKCFLNVTNSRLRTLYYKNWVHVMLCLCYTLYYVAVVLWLVLFTCVNMKWLSPPIKMCIPNICLKHYYPSSILFIVWLRFSHVYLDYYAQLKFRLIYQ